MEEDIMQSQPWNDLYLTRLAQYYDVTRTANFLLLGTVAIILFANTAGAELAIAVLVVGAGLYAILGGDRALSNLTALRADMERPRHELGQITSSGPASCFSGDFRDHLRRDRRYATHVALRRTSYLNPRPCGLAASGSTGAADRVRLTGGKSWRRCW
jgi:hypothetical protein